MEKRLDKTLEKYSDRPAAGARDAKPPQKLSHSEKARGSKKSDQRTAKKKEETEESYETGTGESEESEKSSESAPAEKKKAAAQPSGKAVPAAKAGSGAVKTVEALPTTDRQQFVSALLATAIREGLPPGSK